MDDITSRDDEKGRELAREIGRHMNRTVSGIVTRRWSRTEKGQDEEQGGKHERGVRGGG